CPARRPLLARISSQPSARREAPGLASRRTHRPDRWPLRLRATPLQSPPEDSSGVRAWLVLERPRRIPREVGFARKRRSRAHGYRARPPRWFRRTKFRWREESPSRRCNFVTGFREALAIAFGVEPPP